MALGYTFSPMRRSAIIFVMLFAMIWQSVALARPGSTVNVLADTEHAALHWHEEGHHHHADGSICVDDSQASTFHLLADHPAMTTALLPAVSHHFPVTAASRPSVLDHSQVSDPFLHGLLRPPRLHA